MIPRDRNFYPIHPGTKIEDAVRGEIFEVVVTGRPYKEVTESLALDTTERRSGQKILSLGDGLSDFSARFEEDTGATVISSDPIYKIISSTDTPEEAEAKIQKAGLKGVAVTRAPKKMLKAEDLERLRRKKRPDQDVSYDVERLPLADASLDAIVSAHALRYIDLTKCFPEFLRVLKDSGELRFGHPGFVVRKQGNDMVIFPDKKHTSEYRNKLVEFFAQFPEHLHCYALLEQEEGVAGATVHSIVLSRQDKQPSFDIGTRGKKRRFIHRVARINFADTTAEDQNLLAWKA